MECYQMARICSKVVLAETTVAHEQSCSFCRGSGSQKASLKNFKQADKIEVVTLPRFRKSRTLKNKSLKKQHQRQVQAAKEILKHLPPSAVNDLIVKHARENPGFIKEFLDQPSNRYFFQLSPSKSIKFDNVMLHFLTILLSTLSSQHYSA